MPTKNVTTYANVLKTPPLQIGPVPKPKKYNQTNVATPELIEVDALIGAAEARSNFRVSGWGLTVAVLDTGLNTSHVGFSGRVLPGRNYTNDNGGDANDPTDGNGHGSNVAGIVCIDALLSDGQPFRGIAPGASVVPLKVLSNSGSGSFAYVQSALEWVETNAERYKITACCLSLGDGDNYTSHNSPGDQIAAVIARLKQRNIAVVVAAGNDFFVHKSRQGMGYPAIIKDAISVGAVFDSPNVTVPREYISGAIAYSVDSDQLTPFSQRLHPTTNPTFATDIFAPGAPVLSASHTSDTALDEQDGTSQAAPVITGVVILMQEYHLARTGRLPIVDDLVRWMRTGAVWVLDSDLYPANQIDNVDNTELEFPRVDVLGALAAMEAEL